MPSEEPPSATANNPPSSEGAASSSAPRSKTEPTLNNGRMPSQSIAELYKSRGFRELPPSGKGYIIPTGKRPSRGRAGGLRGGRAGVWFPEPLLYKRRRRRRPSNIKGKVRPAKQRPRSRGTRCHGSAGRLSYSRGKPLIYGISRSPQRCGLRCLIILCQVSCLAPFYDNRCEDLALRESATAAVSGAQIAIFSTSSSEISSPRRS